VDNITPRQMTATITAKRPCKNRGNLPASRRYKLCYRCYGDQTIREQCVIADKLAHAPAGTKACRHCGIRVASRCRGLCCGCYNNGDIRSRYPSGNPSAGRYAPTDPASFGRELARVHDLQTEAGPALALCREIAGVDADGELLRLLTAARRLQRAGLLERAANLLANMADREVKGGV
jgi:hypothetical protein